MLHQEGRRNEERPVDDYFEKFYLAKAIDVKF